MEEKEIFNELTCRNVSAEAWKYIMDNFKHIDKEDKADRVWSSISVIGNDEKYGRIMICLDTKEWRNDSFVEFYAGPGVYDYSGDNSIGYNHRNYPSLRKYVIPKDGEKFDFTPHKITMGVVD